MPTTLNLQFVVVFLIASLCYAPWIPSARADEASPVCCPTPCDDDIWIVSSRHLPGAINCATTAREPQYFRYESGRLRPAGRDEFRQTLGTAENHCVFVHGNRVSSDEVFQTGVSVKRWLTNGPVRCRYVFWSWPSDKIPGLIRDARAKAERSDVESFYLARFLMDYPTGSAVSLIGYSFGARAVTGSLQLCAGGSFRGQQLPSIDHPPVRPRVVLFAAALPRGWLVPNGAHGRALTQVESFLSFYNQEDPALKHFGLVFKPGKPRALGYEGIAANSLGEAGSLLQQYDVTRIVGRDHSLEQYVQSASIMGTVRGQLIATLPSLPSTNGNTTASPVNTP